MGDHDVTERRTAPPGGRPARERPAAAVGAAATPGERIYYLDNVKALLIAGIIASHAIQGYADFGSWTYQDVAEVKLSPIAETISTVALMTLGALFLMALFFLISGLFTEVSLSRKGPSRFVSDRLLRLGVPFVVYTLIVWPVLEYVLLEPILHRGTYWESFTDTDPILDNGPMWFVGVLLIYSLALVAWRRVRPPSPPSGEPLRVRTLVLMALGIGVASFLIRIVFAADTNQALNVHLWSWPEYIALFGLGVAAARHGWLRPVPSRLARGCGIAAIAAILVTAGFVLSAEPLGLTEDAYFGGFRVTAFLAAMTEGVVAVTAPIWVLAFAQRHLNGTGRVRRAAARSSYLAFMLQGPVLVGLALVLRPIDLPGDVKALLVASFGVVLSFALAWPVVTKTRLGKVL